MKNKPNSFEQTFTKLVPNEYVKELVNQEDASFKIKDMEKVTRAPNIRQTCFDYQHFSGKDVVTVSRDGLPLTIFRELDK